MRLRGHRGADPLNLIRVMPAQGGSGISYRRIPVDRKEDAQLNAFRDTRVLTEAALAVALSFVLGFVVLFKMPYGGSVSLEMIPLILLALRQGWKVGVVAGAVYGLLDLAIDPYVVHPVQFILDYPLVRRPGPRRTLQANGAGRRPWHHGGRSGALRLPLPLRRGLLRLRRARGLEPYLYSAAYNAAYLAPSLGIALVVIVGAAEGAGRSAAFAKTTVLPGFENLVACGPPSS